MSSENDVPLNDARRYYEQKFGDRVRNVAKPGAVGPSPSSSGGGRGWVSGSGAVVLVVIVLVRLLGIGRVVSTPSYNYQPPPRVQFDQKMKDDILHPKGKNWVPGDDPNVFPPNGNRNGPPPIDFPPEVKEMILERPIE
jgi:hypothetical protein